MGKQHDLALPGELDEARAHRRLLLEHVEAGHALCVSYSDVKQLYYQNPEFGFYFLKLTSERLFQSGQRSPESATAADTL